MSNTPHTPHTFNITIDVAGDYSAAEKQIIRAIILSRHDAMRDAASVFYRAGKPDDPTDYGQGNLPQSAEDVIITRTTEFAEGLFPGTKVAEQEGYPDTLANVLEHPEE